MADTFASCCYVLNLKHHVSFSHWLRVNRPYSPQPVNSCVTTRLTSSASSHRTFNSFRCFYVVVCNHWRLFSIRCVTHCGLEPPEMVSFMETLTRAPHPAAFCLKLVMTCILSATLLLSLRWNARVKRSCCLCGWGCWVWRRRWAGLN